MDIKLKPAQVNGQITISGSKSQTIRALLVATFASGVSTINNPLFSLDTEACISLCKAFGSKIDIFTNKIVVKPPNEFAPEVYADCLNSGTTMYLAATLAATINSSVTFTGDNQLVKRPVGELLNALKTLGCKVEYLKKENYPPFKLTGPIRGGDVTLASPTSQYLSSLLLGLPLAEGPSVVNLTLLNEKPYVKMSESWLDLQNINYLRNDDMDKYLIEGSQSYRGFEATISGDYSSASFFFAAAAVAKGSVTVNNLDRYDAQGDKEILNILSEMGCNIQWTNTNSVTVSSPKGPLKAGKFDLNAIPDTLPILAVTACYAKGKTILYNVAQARIKETDRIKVMHDNLKVLGASVKEGPDYLEIDGDGSLNGGIVSGYDDHRIIMAMAIASLNSDKEITIKGIDAVNVTFPTFFSQLEQISVPN